MSIRSKPLNAITEADLLELATSDQADRKTLEIKSGLPKHAVREQQEFLREVAAFANAAGGDLIYGISTTQESQSPPLGLLTDNPKAEAQRLESLIRAGIEPGIPGLTVHSLELADARCVFILRIPRSVVGPHWVKHEFYSRTSAGKYLLKHSELRDSFAQSQATVERLRLFRLERIGRILAGETTVPLKPAPKTILHVFPLAKANTISMAGLKERGVKLAPFTTQGFDIKYNIDGAYSHDYLNNDGQSEGYFQVYRNGSVEVASADLTDIYQQNGFIPSWSFEERIVSTLDNIKAMYERHCIEPPYFLALSLLGVKGYEMAIERRSLAWRMKEIDRDDLLLPEVFIEDAGFESSRLLQPVFDIVWNAAGYERSLNYDDQGQWRPRERR